LHTHFESLLDTVPRARQFLPAGAAPHASALRQSGCPTYVHGSHSRQYSNKQLWLGESYWSVCRLGVPFLSTMKTGTMLPNLPEHGSRKDLLAPIWSSSSRLIQAPGSRSRGGARNRSPRRPRWAHWKLHGIHSTAHTFRPGTQLSICLSWVLSANCGRFKSCMDMG
jgi:hypothetical protein